MGIDNLINKNILVLGMARSGVASAIFLKNRGAHVIVNDIKPKSEVIQTVKTLESKGIKTIVGGHPTELLEEIDFIIKSPGIPGDIPILARANELHIPIMGEIELGYLFSRGQIIAVTGTNGKTTTTTLISEILKNDDKEASAAGNIGMPLIQVTESISISGFLVVEVSSFQLENIHKFKPKISVILNITQDHLNVHKTFENYIKAKARIFENQDENDFTILNADDEIVLSLASGTKGKVIFFSRKKELDYGVFIKNNIIVIKDENNIFPICNINEIGIKGNHNIENALAAVCVGWKSNVNLSNLVYTLKKFQGVEHRLELVDTIQGVKFINDSKGTNPDAAVKALEAVCEPIILIAGGMDKGTDFKEFVGSFAGKVKALIVMGEVADKIMETAVDSGFDAKNIIKVSTMEDAVAESFRFSGEGDCVLLSPACASWDMYESFEERGRVFKECVKFLRRKMDG